METDEIAIYFEIAAADARGRDVQGKIRGLTDKVILHWRRKEGTFATEEDEMKTIELAYHEIESVALESRFFLKKVLVFRVRDPRQIAGIPGVEMGRAELLVAPRSKKDVGAFAKLLDYKTAEYRIEQSQERLDRMMEG